MGRHVLAVAPLLFVGCGTWRTIRTERTPGEPQVKDRQSAGKALEVYGDIQAASVRLDVHIVNRCRITMQQQVTEHRHQTYYPYKHTAVGPVLLVGVAVGIVLIAVDNPAGLPLTIGGGVIGGASVYATLREGRRVDTRSVIEPLPSQETRCSNTDFAVPPVATVTTPWLTKLEVRPNASGSVWLKLKPTELDPSRLSGSWTVHAGTLIGSWRPTDGQIFALNETIRAATTSASTAAIEPTSSSPNTVTSPLPSVDDQPRAEYSLHCELPGIKGVWEQSRLVLRLRAGVRQSARCRVNNIGDAAGPRAKLAISGAGISSAHELDALPAFAGSDVDVTFVPSTPGAAVIVFEIGGAKHTRKVVVE